MSGLLYICATPIGNMEDITLRALRTLREADYIAAEDTRHTLKILNHYNINTPMISYHEHNKAVKGKEIIKLLLDGKNIVLVSDAGMPGISDPGEDLVLLAYQNGITVSCIPGPSALTAAAALSGIPCGSFVFQGFMPKDNKNRRLVLSSVAASEKPVILYESPHHLLKTLNELLSEAGNRRACILRELTKKHEEILTETLEELIKHFTINTPRGEFVIVLEPAPSAEPDGNGWENVTIVEHVSLYVESGMDKMEAVKRVAKERKMPKREVYGNCVDYWNRNRYN